LEMFWVGLIQFKTQTANPLHIKRDCKGLAV